MIFNSIGACIFCGENSNCDFDLCVKCAQELPLKEHSCSICGNTLSSSQKICGSCLTTPPPFNQTFALFNYKNPIDHIITTLKFGHNLIYAKILGELFAHFIQEKYQTNLPEIIIPVPLHNSRLRQRGFNQALEIARPIAKKLKTSLDVSSCERSKNTIAQTELNMNERIKNLNNAFAIIKSLNYKHVAIFDDVVTTGSTVHELSKVLRKAGVIKIDVWCCAKT